MSTLLQQLQARGGGYVNDQRPYRKQASLLFDDATAKTISLEQFRDIGLKGLHGLIQLDTRFASYQNTIFKESFMRIDREVASGEYNEAMDESIGIFLNLLSPYFLYTHAHYCLEYLLHAFRIHTHSADKLFRCILPYHEHVLFVRVLQLIPLHRIPLWSFLELNTQSGTPMSTELLVEKALINSSVLIIASQIMSDSADLSTLSNNTISFWTRFATRLISRRSMGEAHVRNIFNIITRGLFSDNENWLSSSLLVIMSLVNNITMTRSLLEDFVDTLCKGIRHHTDKNSANESKNQKLSATLVLFTLAYLVAHSDSNVDFSPRAKISWWSMISFILENEVNKEILAFIQGDFQGKEYACDLFKASIERMLCSYSLSTSRNTQNLKNLIEARIIDFSPTIKENEIFFNRMFDSAYAAFRDSWIEESTSDASRSPSFNYLLFLHHNFSHFSKKRIDTLRAEKDEMLFFENVFLVQLKKTRFDLGLGATNAATAVLSQNSLTHDKGHSDHSITLLLQNELIVSFSVNIDDLGLPTDVDAIVSLTNKQKLAVESVIKVKESVSNSISWHFLASIIGKFHEENLPKLLSWMTHTGVENTIRVGILSRIWEVFHYTNENTSPFIAHLDKLSRYRNACTGIRLAHSLLRYVKSTGFSHEAPSCNKWFSDFFPSANDSENISIMVIERISRHFQKLYQPIISAFYVDSCDTFKGIHSIDNILSYNILSHCIQKESREQLSNYQHGTLVDTFFDAFAEFECLKACVIATTSKLSWQDLIIDGFTDLNLDKKVSLSDSSETFHDRFLWYFSFIQLFQLNDGFWISKRCAIKLCKIYAGEVQSAHRPNLLEYGIREKQAITFLVDGIFVHTPPVQCCSMIMNEMMSYICSNLRDHTETHRILLLYIVGLHKQIQQNANLGDFNMLVEPITSPDALSKTVKILKDFVDLITHFMGKSNNLVFHTKENEKYCFMQIFTMLQRYCHNEFCKNPSDTQKVILIHNFYVMFGFFISKCENGGSVAHFLWKHQLGHDNATESLLFLLSGEIFSKLTEIILPKQIPTELMLHRIFTVAYNSPVEVTALINCVASFAQNRGIHSTNSFLDEFCPQELTGISVNNVIIINCRMAYCQAS